MDLNALPEPLRLSGGYCIRLGLYFAGASGLS